MANLDYGLLIKILQRTGPSSPDGEVLIAARKAHDMVSKAGLQWHQVIIMLHNNNRGQEFESDFSTDALHRAAEAARAKNYAEEIRRKQAARDAAYSEMHEAGNTSAGWTHKGPYDFNSDHRVYTQEKPREEEIEDRAREQTEHINGDEKQTNWFVFAMTEPEVAEWLFRLREGHAFHRILFAQVLMRGELGDNQLQTCRHMMMRDQRSTPR